jgi:hypothetical protein
MNADLSTVYDGLNALGRVPWKINRRVLAVAQRCWDENIALGDVSFSSHCVDKRVAVFCGYANLYDLFLYADTLTHRL